MDRSDFMRALKSALAQLDDFHNLGKSSLLPLLCPPHQQTPLTLQLCLVDAINGLRHAPSAQAERFYEVLHYRYVEHMSQADVAFQMGVSRRQVRREQTNAIELLASRLWEELPNSARHAGPRDGTDPVASPEPGDEDAAVATSGQDTSDFFHHELDYLYREHHSESCEIGAELRDALSHVETLASRGRLTLDLHMSDRICLTPLPHLILRQAVLTVLASLLAAEHGGTLRVSLESQESEHLVHMSLLGDGDRGDNRTRAVAAAEQLLVPFGGQVDWSTRQPHTVTLRLPARQSIPVLLVDDNPDVRHLYRRYTEQSRFQLLATAETDQVIDLVRRHNIRAVVLDVMMPDQDGWDLLAQLRHHPETATLPVAICTILPQAELAQLLGGTLFIQKPVGQREFLAALGRLVASRPPAPG